jgi:hypothetical protein
VSDAKLWCVRVKPGSERETVVSILRRVVSVRACVRACARARARVFVS